MHQLPLKRATRRVGRRRWRAWAPKREQLAADEGRDTARCAIIVAALTDPPRPGTPATCTADQSVQMVAGACEAPAAAGRPGSPWPPREVAEAVRTRGLGAAIRPRRVGRFLIA